MMILVNLLKDNGFNIKDVNKIILELRKGQKVTSPHKKKLIIH